MAMTVGPATPGSGANPGIDSPPPPPPGLQTPDYTGLADNPQSNPQGVPPGTQFLALVTQQAQLVESGAAQLAQMLPTFVPIAAQISAMIRQAVVSAMKQIAQNSGMAGGGPPGGAAAAPGGAPPGPPGVPPQ
jgi:hypothetical protein